MTAGVKLVRGSPEAFRRSWMERVGMTEEEWESSCLKVIRCDCGERDCGGWRVEPDLEKLDRKLGIQVAEGAEYPEAPEDNHGGR